MESRFSDRAWSWRNPLKKEMIRTDAQRAAGRESVRRFVERNPWINSFNCARHRCTRPSNPRYHRYGGRGIRFMLTVEDVMYLWYRDNAASMKQPSIDRVNNDGHYELANCRFIEKSENSRKKNRSVTYAVTICGAIFDAPPAPAPSSAP